MATRHANPGEIVDLDTWAGNQLGTHTQAIVKTDEMELISLFLPSGKEIPTHKVPGPITAHCIQGRAELTAMGSTQCIKSGQLLHLMPEEPHAVKAIEDTIILLTIIFKNRNN